MKKLLLLLVAVCAARAQNTPFYNPAPDQYYSFVGAFAPGPNVIPFQVLSPFVGVQANCGSSTGVVQYIYAAAYDNCYYTNWINAQAGYIQASGDNKMWTAAYQEVFNPDYPNYLMQDWTYETNCDVAIGRAITDYSDDYGCPPGTP